MNGTCIKWLGPFGFILGDDGIEYFAHQTAIRAERGKFRTLIPGERYTFDEENSQRGPQAVGISRLT